MWQALRWPFRFAPRSLQHKRRCQLRLKELDRPPRPLADERAAEEVFPRILNTHLAIQRRLHKDDSFSA